MTLPTNRTTANTAAEHVADHNTLHGLHNILVGSTKTPDAAQAAAIAASQPLDSDLTAIAALTTTAYGRAFLALADAAAARTAIGVEATGTNSWRAIVRKSADEVVNNSTTFQNDDHLLFAVGAGQTWVGRFILFHTGDTVPDIKFAVAVPTGTTLLTAAKVVNLNSSAIHTTGLVTTSGGSLGGSGTTTGGGVTEIFMSFVTTNAGNVVLQWAQSTLTVADVTLKAGSFLIAERVA